MPLIPRFSPCPIERPDYWSEDGKLKTRIPEDYILRVWSNVQAFEYWHIDVGKQIWRPETMSLTFGVPRWSQILSQPPYGYARVSSDGRSMSCIFDSILCVGRSKKELRP